MNELQQLLLKEKSKGNKKKDRPRTSYHIED